MELYEFFTFTPTGVKESKYYTSNATNYIFDSRTYEAIPISRGEISFDFDKNSAKLTMPMDYWPASDYKIVNPYGVINIIIKDELGSILFNGRIGSCGFKIEKGIAELTATSIQEILNSQVPVKTYSYTCPFELYGGLCGKDSETYKVALTYGDLVISAYEITASIFGTYDDGYFEGGWLETKYERTAILTHEGDTITVLFPLREALVSSDYIYVFPGCDKSLETCQAKYANEVNFGGFPWIPEKNPVFEEF